MISVAGEAGLVQPGEQADIGFELNKPVDIEKSVRFAVREGGRTVGAGCSSEDPLTGLLTGRKVIMLTYEFDSPESKNGIT